jgi:hypothetical protein
MCPALTDSAVALGIVGDPEDVVGILLFSADERLVVGGAVYELLAAVESIHG